MRPIVLSAVASFLLLAGCANPPKKLVVGSKLSSEGAVIGEILAQHIQNKLGLPVERRDGMQSSLTAHQSLLSGEVDLYAEDTGTAYYIIFRLPLSNDLDILNSRVPLEYQSMRLKWLAPLGLMASYAVIASPEKVKVSKLSAMRDLDQPLTMSSTLEFQSRLDGFPKLSAAYRIRLSGAVKTVDPDQVGPQVTQNLSHLAVVSTADAILASDKVKILEDDEKVFMSYPTAVVVGEKTLANNPQLEGVLKQLEGKLSIETLRKLLVGVKTQSKTPAAVAGEFLQQAGLR